MGDLTLMQNGGRWDQERVAGAKCSIITKGSRSKWKVHDLQKPRHEKLRAAFVFA